MAAPGSLPTVDRPPPVWVGPLRFELFPDGDDPGVGWLRLDLAGRYGIVGTPMSRAEWDAFVTAAKRGANDQRR